MILSAIQKALKIKSKRNWDRIYIAVDIHNTIVEGNYKTNDIPTEFYPYAKEVLQLFSKREDVKLILFTCSHPHEIESYLKLFTDNGIYFDYINENPEVQSDLDGYGNYEKKFYFNVLMDDKAGFDPISEWEHIHTAFTAEDNQPYIITVKQELNVTYKYNPNYGDDRECICGHPYYRHFDTYEEMAPIGCKYCICGTFVDASTLTVESKLQCHSGTTYKQIWDFVNQHLNKRVKIHYELLGHDTWGNDYEEIMILDEYGIRWLQNYMGTEEEYRDKNSAYIHNITIYS